MKTKTTEEKIAKLRAQYVPGLSMRFAEINQAYMVVIESNCAPEQVQKLEGLSHSLCGSAGTFGFGNIAAYCKKLEEFSRLLLKEAGNTNLMNEISSAIGQLEEATLNPKITDQAPLLEFSSNPSIRQIDKLIYILNDDKALALEMKSKLERYGYAVEYFNHSDDIVSAINNILPEAMIIDSVILDGSDSRAVNLLSKHANIHIPSIVISSNGDFASRLKTVRAGADAFISKPFDTTDIIDTLNILISDNYTKPYRVLIVSDVEAMASYYRIILERAGMICKNLSQPAEILEVLGEFEPEIVLMDLHMPECRGDELAKMIHQEKAYLSMPSVYLSTETNIREQLTALQMVGDDFLSKPILPSQLIGTIITRAQRYRRLHGLMNNDSLTGLLNHSSLKLALDKECARASRNKQTFCFAMIDLDRFSDINNQFGHTVGDSVLKNLAWLFKERLRKTDVIGRYGGEVFGIVMPDTSLEAGKQILDKLLDEFQKIEFRFNDSVFVVSFSAGVVAYPDYQSGDDICNAAERLLNDAKAAGRQQVVAHHRIISGKLAHA